MGQPQLQTLLEAIFDDLDLDPENVYFQPPENTTMQYPCIVYERDSADFKFAGNRPYSFTWRYQLKVIAREPDTGIPERIAALPLCVFDRHYTADRLNHDVFNLYF